MKCPVFKFVSVKMNHVRETNGHLVGKVTTRKCILKAYNIHNLLLLVQLGLWLCYQRSLV